MPSHNHNAIGYFNAENNPWTGWLSGGGEKNIEYRAIPTQGGDQAHNNIQPYRAVYVFRRNT